jgi:membrane protein YqaA with SNARE-associated domain
MMHKLIAWTESFAKHKKATWYLFAVAFTESSFFLVPPDVLIIAMLSHGLQVSWIRVASISTLGSVLGGVFGYIIGKVFYETVGVYLVHLYGLEAQVTHVGELFKENAFLSILVAAFTPIPYKVFTISAGLFSLNILTFIVASILGRGGRFFIVAYLTHRYGMHAKKMILEKADKVFLVLGLAVLVGLYFLYR